jgi:hypothetical protein
MVRRSPCEYYIKYLTSHPANYSNEYIKEHLLTAGLDWLSDAYVDRVRATTIRPLPFRPFDKEHTASQFFLSKHRIYTMFFKDDATRCAVNILEHPRSKEFVEAMSLTGSSRVLIARGANHVAMPPFALTEAGVRRFQHYFWNTDLLDFTELRAVIAKRGAESEDKEYKKAFYKDSRKVACELPFNPISTVLSQLRMGITPRGVDFSELMERVRLVAGVKAYQAVLEDSQYSSENARNFITVAQGATDLMERTQRPEAKLAEQFQRMRMTTDNRPIPHIKELSAGRHTTDLQPTEARAEVVEVDDEA